MTTKFIQRLRRRPRRQQAGRRGESGAALIEAIIGLYLITIIITGSLTHLWLVYRSHELGERQRKAEEWVEAGMNALESRSQAEVPASGGTFSVNADGSITLTGACDDSTCDLVVEPSPALTARTSPAAGLPWSQRDALPAGALRTFVRRWRVDNVDAARGLRRITVSVLVDEQATQPLSMRDEEAVVSVR